MKKVKIYENKLVTTNEEGVKEIWNLGYGESKFFLRFKGKVWYLKTNENYNESPED